MITTALFGNVATLLSQKYDLKPLLFTNFYILLGVPPAHFPCNHSPLSQLGLRLCPPLPHRNQHHHRRCTLKTLLKRGVVVYVFGIGNYGNEIILTATNTFY